MRWKVEPEKPTRHTLFKNLDGRLDIFVGKIRQDGFFIVPPDNRRQSAMISSLKRTRISLAGTPG
jgi:hypothetical protein